MKIKISLPRKLRQAVGGFSIVEGVVSMGLLCTVAGALCSGLTSGFFTMQMARENQRATQILLEKVETIRLYNWDQLTTNGFIPTSFTNYYDPDAATGSKGIQYVGTLTITNAPIAGASYSNDLKLVRVRLTWATGGLQRSREFQSYVSRYGLQDFIY